MKEIKTTNDVCFKRWSRAGFGIFASLHCKVKIGVLSVAMSILLLGSQTAYAEVADSIKVMQIHQIDSVAVTGSRVAPTRSVMTQTVLFDRKVQSVAPLQTMEDALRLSPSVDLRERGGKGVQADILIRGGSFDQTMVLLNGVNFTDARTGHQSHSLPIDMDCIGGIDMIDGVTGVGGLAGAVNIRTAPASTNYLRLDAQGGSHGYGYANLSGGYSGEKFTIFSAASYRRSGGYITNTDFDNINSYVRAGYQSKAGYFDFQAGYQSRKFGSNGFYAAYNPNQYEETSTTLGSLRWKQHFGRFDLSSTLSYRKNNDRYDWNRGTPMNYHTTDNVGGEVTGDYNWASGVTSFGVDYTYNHIFSTNLGEELVTPHGKYLKASDRNVTNFWLGHNQKFGKVSIAASGGISSTEYGTAAIWSGVVRYTPSTHWQINAGVAQSMRLPTFTDLYYTSPAQINNLDLQPEKAITYHVNGRFNRNGWNLSAHTFYRAGRDIIDWVWREELQKWHSEQESCLNTFGVELMGGYMREEGFFRGFNAAYSYLSTTQRADIVTSSAMDYMRNKSSVTLYFNLARNLSLTLTTSLFDREGGYNDYLRDSNGELLKDNNGAMVTEFRNFKPYVLVDGRVMWQRKWCRLYVDATNITNTSYCDFGGIELPKAWLTGGMTIILNL